MSIFTNNDTHVYIIALHVFGVITGLERATAFKRLRDLYYSQMLNDLHDDTAFWEELWKF